MPPLILFRIWKYDCGPQDASAVSGVKSGALWNGPRYLHCCQPHSQGPNGLSRAFVPLVVKVIFCSRFVDRWFHERRSECRCEVRLESEYVCTREKENESDCEAIVCVCGWKAVLSQNVLQ